VPHASDRDRVRTERNTARYFTETRHVAWVLLVGTILWGVYGYLKMPKAKDPLIPVRQAVALCNWPGASAEKIEELVTTRIEQKIAENSKVDKIESVTRGSVAVVYVTLQQSVTETGKEFDDIKLKLDGIRELPQGAGPINFIKDFGDTAALMLTVASPKASEVEIALRARSLANAITFARSQAAPSKTRATLVASFPPAMNSSSLRRVADALAKDMDEAKVGRDVRVVEGAGFLGLDAETDLDDPALLGFLRTFVQRRLRLSELHPDVWAPIIVRDPKDAQARLEAVAGDRYTYRELDLFTDKIQRYLQALPMVSKVTRSGVLPERVYLDYSQERLAAYGVQQSGLANVLAARNITVPGGVVEIAGKNLTIDPTGEFKTERDIGDVLMTTSASGVPVYLRDAVEVSRDYQSPPRFLNAYTHRDARGAFQRSRAITLSVQMRPGEQIEQFGQAIDLRLGEVKQLLPEDLVYARTSDQPLQVRENVSLFMSSLYEAIVLVVAVALIGFWEWRSAVLMALSIPVTLAMTFGLMSLLGLDIQQVSIASLIIALGLLVDDPVVAGDAIKRSLGEGWKPVVAAWLGPTKLGRAILFATVTNIVAYLPFLALPGDTGRFIYTLPVVLTCSLVASRLVSMSFIPLLGYYLLRPSKKAEPTLEERRRRGFGKYYSRTIGWAIDHRRMVFALSLVLLAGGLVTGSTLKKSFFPNDLAYLSYVDVWLPEDAPLSATREAAQQADVVIRDVAEAYGKEHGGHEPRDVLQSVTMFVGGGGPRFWFSVAPEQQQLNYAQLIVQVKDKHDTGGLVPRLQEELTRRIAGARIDVRQLENGKAVGVPVAVRIAGEDGRELRAIAERVKAVFRDVPTADRVRDDWGAESFAVKLEVDSDRANLAGITNLDVAQSSALAMNGRTVGSLRDNDTLIPIVARLRSEERAQLADIQNLYVTPQQGSQKVPLRQVSSVEYRLETEKIRRRNQFRTITVSCFPVSGVLPSEVLRAAQAKVEAIGASLPPGYTLTIAGEQEEQKKGFGDLAKVLGISVAAIFLALVLQFKNAVKPVIVFAAIPYGVAGALVSLRAMGTPFGFMAFLGIISLIGVIVSHVIVLFDFIEERHEEGAPLREALVDAGILRLRPVLITVGATVLGLVPLAAHGGPLWESLCYAQIGGLTVATFLTLLLVPVLYAIFVLDLKLVRWERPAAEPHDAPIAGAAAAE
jgi:multidrug efflux pump subunit AcrB